MVLRQQNRTAVILGALILGLLSLVSCQHTMKESTIIDGRLDYSGSSALRLDGEWDFYPGVFYNPSLSLGSDHTKIRVPGIWNGANGAWGIGTYRIMIYGLNPGSLYAFQFKGILTNAEIWVNGVKIGDHGAKGPDFIPRTLHFSADGWDAEVIIAVENSMFAFGGMWLPVWFGTSEALEQSSISDRFIDMMLIGGVFMMGMYHLFIYAFRPKDRSPLYFGLFCVFSIIKAGLSGEQVLALHMPFLDQLLGIRIAYIATILLTPTFYTYITELFKINRPLWVTNFFLIASTTQGVFSLFFPIHLVQVWFWPTQIVIVISCIYVVWLLIIEMRKKSPSSIFMFLGFLVIFASAVNDVLHDNKLIVTFYSLNMGLFVFLFTQALVIGSIFSRGFREVQEQNATLTSTMAKKDSELDLLTRHDALTGLINRRHFFNLLASEWEGWQKQGLGFSLAVMDLDDFSALNRDHGRGIGDKLLCRTADLVQGLVSKNVCVARLGGDNFALILPGVGLADAWQLMEKVRISLAAESFDGGGKHFHLSLSYGISSGASYRSPESSLDAAEKLMYRAKEQGRNRGLVEGLN